MHWEDLGTRLRNGQEVIGAVDFDGTIVEYDGWKGYKHIGEEKEGAIDTLKELIDMGVKIIVYTTRCNPTMPDHHLAWLEVKLWLKEQGLGDVEITGLKPYAHFYVDDRAIRFDSWGQVLEDLSTHHALVTPEQHHSDLVEKQQLKQGELD